MNKYSKGFTIIELIVVIAIIAVLAGIVLVNVTQYINKSKNAAVLANLRSLQTAAANYIIDNNGGSMSGFCNSAIANTIMSGVAKLSANTTSCVDYSGHATWNNTTGERVWYSEFLGCAAADWVAVEGTRTIHFCTDSKGFIGAPNNGTIGTCSCI